MLTSKASLHKRRKAALKSPLARDFMRHIADYNTLYDQWLYGASPEEVAFAFRMRRFLGVQKEMRI